MLKGSVLSMILLATTPMTSYVLASENPTSKDAQKIFAIADALANSSHLDLKKVESITGCHFHKNGDFGYRADDAKDLKLFSDVEILTDAKAPVDHEVGLVTLYIPKLDEPISRKEVEKKFGSKPTKTTVESYQFGKSTWGADKLEWLKFKRSDGGWNCFGYDATGDKRLCGVTIITAPESGGSRAVE